jgi:hypothetical protein
LFDIDPTIDVKVAKLSKTNERTADMVLKCQCGNFVAVRFPRNANPDIKMARGIQRH